MHPSDDDSLSRASCRSGDDDDVAKAEYFVSIVLLFHRLASHLTCVAIDDNYAGCTANDGVSFAVIVCGDSSVDADAILADIPATQSD